jgi:hypothetical protein
LIRKDIEEQVGLSGHQVQKENKYPDG